MAKKIKVKKSKNRKEFNIAVQHFQAGNLHLAKEICSRILQKEGKNPDVLHLMGLLAVHAVQYDDAIDYISKAVCINPKSYEYYNSLGLALKSKGMIDEAIESFSDAVKLKPDFPEGYFKLGNLFEEKGLFNKAIENYKKVLKLNPYSVETYNNLGFILEKEGLFDEAIEQYEKVLTLKPDVAYAYNNLGNIFAQKRMTDKAISYYKKALMLQPDFAEAYNNLAGAFNDKGMLDEGIENIKKALIFKPDYADAYNNLGLVLSDKGLIEEAIGNYKKALFLNPDNAEIHANLGMTYLLSKDFERGWNEYEWTLRYTKVPVLRKPIWDGTFLNGKSILVYAVYGYGDSLQFVRFLPLLSDEYKAKNVLFVPQKGLEQLLRESDLKAEILDVETTVESLQYDTNIHLLSLPRMFRTNLENIPFKQKRYLKANPEKVNLYREKFFDPTPYTLHPSPFRIGLFWQGNPALKPDRNRSMPLQHFYQLCRLPNVKVYSLQKGYGIEQLNDLPEDVEIVNLGETFNDFSDTAAAIENLDLMITVDTAIGHLSGALGKKTWILLPSHAEWRWHLNMDYSPWYEDVRLFRHKELGKKDWKEMMERVVEELLKNRAEGIGNRV